MSLLSTPVIKQTLADKIGNENSPVYFSALEQFIAGKTSRAELEETILPLLDSPALIQQHNALIISIFDARSFKRPPTPPPEKGPEVGGPPRKRRRLFPYQGPDEPEEPLISDRLRTWALSVGKQERDRLRQIQNMPAPIPRPRLATDEIIRERGVVLLPERNDPPGSRLGVQLMSLSQQHIIDRVNLISAQHNLGAPLRSVSNLLAIACEIKLKQLITHALTLTSSSSTTMSSISTTHSTTPPKVLTSNDFETLFTMAPSDLPEKSAAAMRLAILGSEKGKLDDPWDHLPASLRDAEERDEEWQLHALLAERSGVRAVMNGS